MLDGINESPSESSNSDHGANKNRKISELSKLKSNRTSTCNVPTIFLKFFQELHQNENNLNLILEDCLATGESEELNSRANLKKQLEVAKVAAEDIDLLINSLLAFKVESDKILMKLNQLSVQAANIIECNSGDKCLLKNSTLAHFISANDQLTNQGLYSYLIAAQNVKKVIDQKNYSDKITKLNPNLTNALRGIVNAAKANARIPERLEDYYKNKIEATSEHSEQEIAKIFKKLNAHRIKFERNVKINSKLPLHSPNAAALIMPDTSEQAQHVIERYNEGSLMVRAHGVDVKLDYIKISKNKNPEFNNIFKVDVTNVENEMKAIHQIADIDGNANRAGNHGVCLTLLAPGLDIDWFDDLALIHDTVNAPLRGYLADDGQTKMPNASYTSAIESDDIKKFNHQYKAIIADKYDIQLISQLPENGIPEKNIIYFDKNQKNQLIYTMQMPNGKIINDQVFYLNTGCDLSLMSKLRNNDPEEAQSFTLYLGVGGKYVVRDPQCKVHKGILPKIEGIDWSEIDNLEKMLRDPNLKMKLEDPAFKIDFETKFKDVQNMFKAPSFKRAVLEITSQRGHTSKKSLNENEFLEQLKIKLESDLTIEMLQPYKSKLLEGIIKTPLSVADYQTHYRKHYAEKSAQREASGRKNKIYNEVIANLLPESINGIANRDLSSEGKIKALILQRKLMAKYGVLLPILSYQNAAFSHYQPDLVEIAKLANDIPVILKKYIDANPITTPDDAALIQNRRKQLQNKLKLTSTSTTLSSKNPVVNKLSQDLLMQMGYVANVASWNIKPKDLTANPLTPISTEKAMKRLMTPFNLPKQVAREHAKNLLNEAKKRILVSGTLKTTVATKQVPKITSPQNLIAYNNIWQSVDNVLKSEIDTNKIIKRNQDEDEARSHLSEIPLYTNENIEVTQHFLLQTMEVYSSEKSFNRRLSNVLHKSNELAITRALREAKVSEGDIHLLFTTLNEMKKGSDEFLPTLKPAYQLCVKLLAKNDSQIFVSKKDFLTLSNFFGDKISDNAAADKKHLDVKKKSYFKMLEQMAFLKEYLCIKYADDKALEKTDMILELENKFKTSTPTKKSTKRSAKFSDMSTYGLACLTTCMGFPRLGKITLSLQQDQSVCIVKELISLEGNSENKENSQKHKPLRSAKPIDSLSNLLSDMGFQRFNRIASLLPEARLERANKLISLENNKDHVKFIEYANTLAWVSKSSTGNLVSGFNAKIDNFKKRAEAFNALNILVTQNSSLGQISMQRDEFFKEFANKYFRNTYCSGNNQKPKIQRNEVVMDLKKLRNGDTTYNIAKPDPVLFSRSLENTEMAAPSEVVAALATPVASQLTVQNNFGVLSYRTPVGASRPITSTSMEKQVRQRVTHAQLQNKAFKDRVLFFEQLSSCPKMA